MANAATNATAPRAVFGIDASHRVSRATGGDDATTNPPTITSAICMVKLTSDQKPFPNSVASVTGFTPANIPPMKTSTIAASANTNASGNHRSQTSAMRDPARARRFERIGVHCRIRGRCPSPALRVSLSPQEDAGRGTLDSTALFLNDRHFPLESPSPSRFSAGEKVPKADEGAMLALLYNVRKTARTGLASAPLMRRGSAISSYSPSSMPSRTRPSSMAMSFFANA